MLTITEQERVISNPSNIHSSAVNYFEQILISPFSPSDTPSFSNIPQLVTDEMNEFLCRMPDEQEVKKAVDALNKDASAGLDGYTASFFQANWNFIKDDLMEAVMDYFAGSPLPVGISSTALALIPKVSFPSYWNEYRPVSICNCTHKIISKLLNDRLASYLHLFISENQKVVSFQEDLFLITFYWPKN